MDPFAQSIPPSRAASRIPPWGIARCTPRELTESSPPPPPFRRLGHNELDNPRATQPLTYRRILDQPTVVTRYRRQLEEGGVVAAEEAEAWRAAVWEELQRGYEAARAGEFKVGCWEQQQQQQLVLCRHCMHPLRGHFCGVREQFQKEAGGRLSRSTRHARVWCMGCGSAGRAPAEQLGPALAQVDAASFIAATWQGEALAALSSAAAAGGGNGSSWRNPVQEPTGLPLSTLQWVGQQVCRFPQSFQLDPDVQKARPG